MTSEIRLQHAIEIDIFDHFVRRFPGVEYVDSRQALRMLQRAGHIGDDKYSDLYQAIEWLEDGPQFLRKVKKKLELRGVEL